MKEAKTDMVTINAVIEFCESNGFSDVFEGKATKMETIKFLAHPGFDGKILDVILEEKVIHEEMTVGDKFEAWQGFLEQSGLNSEGFQTQAIIQNAVQMMAKQMINDQLSSQK